MSAKAGEMKGGLSARVAATSGRGAAPSPEEVEAFVEKHRDFFEATCAKYPTRRSAMLPVLWRLQREFGWLSPPVLRAAAKVLRVAPGEVFRVASFYTMFRDRPCGKYVISVCGTLSCALVGADAVLEALEKELGIRAGGTTEDGLFTLERVECLGWCDRGPLLQVNEGEYQDRLTPEDAVALVRRLRAGDFGVEVVDATGGKV